MSKLLLYCLFYGAWCIFLNSFLNGGVYLAGCFAGAPICYGIAIVASKVLNKLEEALNDIKGN